MSFLFTSFQSDIPGLPRHGRGEQTYHPDYPSPAPAQPLGCNTDDLTNPIPTHGRGNELTSRVISSAKPLPAQGSRLMSSNMV